MQEYKLYTSNKEGVGVSYEKVYNFPLKLAYAHVAPSINSHCIRVTAYSNIFNAESIDWQRNSRPMYMKTRIKLLFSHISSGPPYVAGQLTQVPGL